MKILFLTVDHNYHVPILLRDVISQLPVCGVSQSLGDEIKIIISGKRKCLTVRKVLKQYGILYTLHKFKEKMIYLSKWMQERGREENIFYRKYLSLQEVLEYYRRHAVNIPVEQVEDINSRTSTQVIREFSPDLLVSVYFDQILSGEILRLSKHNINLHPSLLPTYAGGIPTFWVMAKGENTTGITIHEITQEVDSGRILFQEEISIGNEDTQFTLYRRCTQHFTEPLLNYIECCRKNMKFDSILVSRALQKSYYFAVKNHDVRHFLKSGRRFI